MYGEGIESSSLALKEKGDKSTVIKETKYSLNFDSLLFLRKDYFI